MSFHFILENECSGRYDKLFLSNVVKNMNTKVFNLMSRTNETCYVSWHQTYACKCRLDASVCDNMIINSVGIIINANVAGNNWLMKTNVRMD